MSTLLEVKNIGKAFDGFKAVDDVSFMMSKGELNSIIGPNGAGKTTLFSLLSGKLRPDTGQVFFNGKDITGLPPHKICKMGIGRAFQRTNIFPKLTAFENIQVAVMSWKNKSQNLYLDAQKMFRDEVDEILDSIGLGEKKQTTAGLLAHGDQKLLDIGIALANQSEMLMLDEPTAGMSPEESGKAIELIGHLVKEKELTLLFIEHDMNIVFKISEKILVMHNGRLIAEGAPEEIRNNEEVQRIYFAQEDV